MEKENIQENQKELKKKISAIAVLSIMCIACVSCFLVSRLWHKSSPVKDCARETSVTALNYSLRNPQTVKIVNVSQPDSIVDFRFFSKEDSREIMAVMEYLSTRTLASYQNAGADSLSDEAMYELSESSSRAGLALQAMMNQAGGQQASDNGSKLSGWKVKIIYDKTDGSGKTSRWQRWFAVSPDGRSVLESYDFPFVVAND